MTSVDDNGDLIIWDLALGQAIGLPIQTGQQINTLTYSADGRQLITGDSAGQVILWDVDIDNWRTTACHIANRNITPEEWRRFFGTAPYHQTCTEIPSVNNQSPVLPTSS